LVVQSNKRLGELAMSGLFSVVTKHKEELCCGVRGKEFQAEFKRGLALPQKSEIAVGHSQYHLR